MPQKVVYFYGNRGYVFSFALCVITFPLIIICLRQAETSLGGGRGKPNQNKTTQRDREREGQRQRCGLAKLIWCYVVTLIASWRNVNSGTSYISCPSRLLRGLKMFSSPTFQG